MLPCGSTLGGVEGDASVIAYWVCTLIGGVPCGAAALLNISASCLSAAVCLSPNAVSGLVGVRLRRAWVRPEAACIAVSFDEILGSVIVSRKTM